MMKMHSSAVSGIKVKKIEIYCMFQQVKRLSVGSHFGPNYFTISRTIYYHFLRLYGLRLFFIHFVFIKG